MRLLSHCSLSNGTRRAWKDFEHRQFTIFSQVRNVRTGGARTARAHSRSSNGVVTAWSPVSTPGWTSSVQVNRVPLVRPSTQGHLTD